VILDAPWIHQGTTWRNIHTGATLPINPPGTDPDPPPIAPTSWRAAVDSGDVTQVATWYETHTGHDGINPNNPNDTPLALNDLTWVEDGIKSTHDGQVLEGLHSNHIRIAHNNVTVRRCRVTDGALYGAYYSPTYGATITGTILEYTTFRIPVVARAPVLLRPDWTTERSALVQHCELIGGDSGLQVANNTEARYNYVRDQLHLEGVHSTSLSFYNGEGLRAYRNFLTEGTSAVCNLYGTRGWSADLLYQENIVGGTIHMPDGRVISPLASPSYAFTMGAAEEPGQHNVRLIDNWFYGGYQYGLMSGDFPWGQNGNVRSGNRALQDFMVQPDSPSNRREYTAGELLPINDE